MDMFPVTVVQPLLLCAALVSLTDATAVLFTFSFNSEAAG